MTDVKDVLKIHSLLIDKFGGSKGIRDKGALESALFRPDATFDQKELYPSPVEKAAAILESLVNNHPFIDGNKRTAYVVTRLLLLSYGLDIDATQDEKYNLVISVAKGEMKFDQIKDWLAKRLKKNEV
jgi:death on curing protein